MQHSFQLFVAEPVGAGLDPIAESPGDLQGLGIAATGRYVQQPGVDLVQRVVRGPHAAGRLDAVDERFGEGTQIAARPQRLLALGQFAHEQGRPVLEPLVARRREQQRAPGQIVPQEVPPHFDLGASHPPSGSADEGKPAFSRIVCSSRSTSKLSKYCRSRSSAALNGPSSRRTFSSGNG